MATTIDGLSDPQVAELLLQTHVIALLGASAKPQRPSYGVMAALLAAGYRVYPINPGQAGEEILGQRAYASLDEVPEAIDMVDVFRAPDAAMDIAQQAVSLGVKSVWYQLGVINADALAYLQARSVPVVMDRCTKIEIARLI
ncbi:MAG: CoA-binding protein [Pontibacterium sp.]